MYTCIVLVFGGCIQAINDKYIKEQLTLLFVDLLLIEAFLAVTFSVQFFRDGYIIRHDEIVFFHKFKKNRKKIEGNRSCCDIECIHIFSWNKSN